MTNSAFHRLREEFDTNYKWNTAFREYCDSIGIMYVGFYGEITARTESMKSAREVWKKSGRLWFADSWEAGEWINSAPFGEVDNEKLAMQFVKEYRRAEKLCRK